MAHKYSSIEAIAEGLFKVRNDSVDSTHANDDSLDRDTLFVGSPGTNSERIVTYNGGKLFQVEKSTRDTFSSAVGRDDGINVIDCDIGADCFNIARIILCRLLPGTDRRYVRASVSFDDKDRIVSLLDGLLIANNISRFSLTVLKRVGYSNQATILIYSTPTNSQISFKKLPTSLYEHPGSLASILFQSLYEQDESVEMIIDDSVEQLMKIVSVISSESMSDLPLLTLEIEPCKNLDSLSSISVKISKSSDCLKHQLGTIFRESFLEASDSEQFKQRLLDLSGSYISLSLAETFEASHLTSAIIRLFLGGYCGVSLDIDSASSAVCSRRVWECMLVVVKYFDISFRLCKGPNIVITRKCLTIDPAVVPEPPNTVAKDTVEFGESSSLLAIGSFVLTAISKSGECKISLSRSVPLATGLSSVLVQASENCEVRIHTVGKDLKQRIIMSFKSEKNIDTNNISEYLTQLGGDVSPSNYKPVDATIRHGSDEEIATVRTQLRALVPGESKRFSLLLVGPWNIGAGVRIIAEEASADNAPVYEFVSERAVRDSAGLTLKCAARIFVRKALDARIDIDDLVSTCAVVDVVESDSRITVANKLFTLLNEASSSNPYVLIRADGDYCTFIAAMSVVVANGWSRTIQQRVETRVMKDEGTTVYYVTRLIVNSLLTC
jgi:hypothetical protein